MPATENMFSYNIGIQSAYTYFDVCFAAHFDACFAAHFDACFAAHFAVQFFKHAVH